MICNINIFLIIYFKKKLRHFEQILSIIAFFQFNADGFNEVIWKDKNCYQRSFEQKGQRLHEKKVKIQNFI